MVERADTALRMGSLPALRVQQYVKDLPITGAAIPKGS